MSDFGTIKLYKWGTTVVARKVYYSKAERKRIIEIWRRQRGNEFDCCTLQICPGLRAKIKELD